MGRKKTTKSKTAQSSGDSSNSTIIAEKLFLRAAEYGDINGLRETLDAPGHQGVDLNCTDAMGRGALRLAIEKENIEIIEQLLGEPDLNITTQDLLIAVDEEVPIAVEMLLKHLERNPISKSNEKLDGDGCFSADITPLILASHRNNYEIITILLEHGHSISPPVYPVKEEGSLAESRSRINTYKALAGPAFITLTTEDPILYAFELSIRLQILRSNEVEFCHDYEELVLQVEDFAENMLEYVNDSDELLLILSYSAKEDNPPIGIPKLHRLQMALEDKHKKFVGHPNCQQLIMSQFYSGIPGWRTANILTKTMVGVCIGMLFPILSIMYIIVPSGRLVDFVSSPIIKFIAHFSSNIVFLLLLSIVSVDHKIFGHGLTAEKHLGQLPSIVEIIIYIYNFGQTWLEVKAIWDDGWASYLKDMWNVLDVVTHSLYLITIVLRLEAFVSYMPYYEYMMTQPRVEWISYDPTLVAEAAFALANVGSFLRFMGWFMASQYLGPMQMALGSMVFDCVKFAIIFFLVFVAFASGLNQLYWFYTSRGDQVTYTNAFATLPGSMTSLFWDIYGYGDGVDTVLLDPDLDQGAVGYTEAVGKFLLAAYHIIVITVMMNMLIAMMSKSLEDIQANVDIEWKFERSKLWYSFISQGGTVPPPFNIIPSVKSLLKIVTAIKQKIDFWRQPNKRQQEQTKKSMRRMNLDNEYKKIMKIVSNRYMSHNLRDRADNAVTIDDMNELKQEMTSFRFEVMDHLKKLNGVLGVANEISPRRKSKLGNISEKPDDLNHINNVDVELSVLV